MVEYHRWLYQTPIDSLAVDHQFWYIDVVAVQRDVEVVVDARELTHYESEMTYSIGAREIRVIRVDLCWMNTIKWLPPSTSNSTP
jgi:hypothetical protein